MTILLVRHGETEWNRARRFQGRLDSPLTERGIGQARAIGRWLAKSAERDAPIVASPLGRARRTAEIILDEIENLGALPNLGETDEFGATGRLRLDDRLREHSLGPWDGLTYAEIEARAPGIFAGDGRHEWCFRTPGGERYGALAARIGDWLAQQNDALPLIVVVHGLVSRLMRGLYAGLPRAAALNLPVPQNRVFRLAGGTIEALEIAADQPTGRL